MKKHIRHKKHRPRNLVSFFIRAEDSDELWTVFTMTKEELRSIETVGRYKYGLVKKTKNYYNILLTLMLEDAVTEFEAIKNEEI